MTLFLLLLLLLLLDLAATWWGADSRPRRRSGPDDIDDLGGVNNLDAMAGDRSDGAMDALTGGWWAQGARRW